MDYFKNFTNEDLLAVQEMTGNEWNDFVHEHHYGVCNACGNEVLYVSMPILTSANWKRCIEHFGLTDRTDMGVAYAYKVGSAEAKLDKINILLRKCTKSVLLCPHCMEKALGHKLTREDLAKCGYSEDYIKKHNL